MSRLYLIFMGIGIVGTLIYLIFASNGQALEREAIYIGLVLSAALLVMDHLPKSQQNCY